jgi:uncharacterized glyoxalase superfamily protein PhnB
LNFNGDAAEAMRFYHSVLGAQLHLQTSIDQVHPSLQGVDQVTQTRYFNALAEASKIAATE